MGTCFFCMGLLSDEQPAQLAQAEITTDAVAIQVHPFVAHPALLNQHLSPRLLDASTVGVRQAPDSLPGADHIIPATNAPPDFVRFGRCHLRHGETIGALPSAVDEYQKVFCHSESGN